MNWGLFTKMTLAPFLFFFAIMWGASSTVGFVVWPMLFAWHFDSFWWGFVGLGVWWVSLSLLMVAINSD